MISSIDKYNISIEHGQIDSTFDLNFLEKGSLDVHQVRRYTEDEEKIVGLFFIDYYNKKTTFITFENVPAELEKSILQSYQVSEDMMFFTSSMNNIFYVLDMLTKSFYVVSFEEIYKINHSLMIDSNEIYISLYEDGKNIIYKLNLSRDISGLLVEAEGIAVINGSAINSIYNVDDSFVYASYGDIDFNGFGMSFDMLWASVEDEYQQTREEFDIKKPHYIILNELLKSNDVHFNCYLYFDNKEVQLDGCFPDIIHVDGKAIYVYMRNLFEGEAGKEISHYHLAVPKLMKIDKESLEVSEVILERCSGSADRAVVFNDKIVICSYNKELFFFDFDLSLISSNRLGFPIAKNLSDYNDRLNADAHNEVPQFVDVQILNQSDDGSLYSLRFDETSLEFYSTNLERLKILNFAEILKDFQFYIISERVQRFFV